MNNEAIEKVIATLKRQINECNIEINYEKNRIADALEDYNDRQAENIAAYARTLADETAKKKILEEQARALTAAQLETL